MHITPISRFSFRPTLSRWPALSIILLLLLACLGSVKAQLTVANPNWNITLTDYGYSDFLLDNTPGFEGREYLSGEWGAAVGYQVAGRPLVSPQWLEPNFLFPDWPTNSTFRVVTPLAETGLNADGLPIAVSVIANDDIQITLRFEMMDTVVGTPMGIKAAPLGGSGGSIDSNRYVMKQTSTIKNISGAAISNLQLFQLLHGLNGQRGVFDNRLYAGPLSEFRHDTTLVGVDPWAVGPGSSADGLEDYLGFHSSVAPTAREIGYYGIEGNGVDDHGLGKPSDGVHLSVEANWLTAPYNSRQGTDSFAPSNRWVSGAQRWDLGTLAVGQSVSLDVVLSLRTGTRVPTGGGSSGGCNGGSGVPGGMEYSFDDVSSEGSCFGEYSRADSDEIATMISAGEFDAFTFVTPGQPAQVWEVEFSGSFNGNVNLTFGYDTTLLPVGFDEATLCLYTFNGGAWHKVTGTVDTALHTITAAVSSLGYFVLGTDGGTVFSITTEVSPAASGTTAGGGDFADGSTATLVATPNPGYVFAGWKDGATTVSSSPSYSFTVTSNLTLTANFVLVGDGQAVTTSASPANAGSTTGDGAYGLGGSATVVATALPGYKFSKWTLNGVTVSSSRNYTFTVTGPVALLAKFKPVYTVLTSSEPVDGGDTEADPSYEFGDPAKLKAIPNGGYSFVNWTENGVEVSTDPDFNFSVTGNRTLVAHFALGHRIDASAEPYNGGIVSGAGVVESGASADLVAAPKQGYVFLNWTENGDVVSTDAAYSFVSAQDRVLVANFIALPPITTTRPAPGTMKVSWPNGAAGWVLQESPDMTPTSWVNSTRTVNVVAGQNEITISPLSGQLFFRLAHP